MRVVLVGVNHRTASVGVRERLAYGKAGVRLALGQLLDRRTVAEAAILSTCNRTEIYAAGAEGDPQPLFDLLLASGVAEKELARCVFVREGEEAATHLHRVAAGLDSMVLGEAQVLGQVKDALALATEVRAAGPVLDRLFRGATTAGKRVRTETGLARGAVSVSHAAVELARRIFGSLRGLNAVILGAGEMSKVTARLLSDTGLASMIVANRTYERAEKIAQQIGGKAIHFEEFYRLLGTADLVVCSTAAPHPVVRREHLLPVLGSRRGKPLLLVDIAVPRDVEAEVGDLEGVFLFCIDDLQGVVDENLAERKAEVDAAEAIVCEETGKFLAWLRSLDAAPLLAALQQEGERAALDELGKAKGRLQHLSERDWQLVELVARGVARRLLRQPIQAVKRFAAETDARHPLEVFQECFGLEQAAGPPADGKPEGETAELAETSLG